MRHMSPSIELNRGTQPSLVCLNQRDRRLTSVRAIASLPIGFLPIVLMACKASSLTDSLSDQSDNDDDDDVGTRSGSRTL